MGTEKREVGNEESQSTMQKLNIVKFHESGKRRVSSGEW